MVLERNRRYSLLLQAVARLKWHQKSLSQMAALCRSASRAWCTCLYKYIKHAHT